MLKRLVVVSIFALIGCANRPGPVVSWKTVYYSVGANDVLLWDVSKPTDCILGTGPQKVLSRLRDKSIEGRAQILIEALPALEPLPQLPPGAIVFDRTVKVRGIPVHPQCESAKIFYWITDARYLDSIPRIK